MSPAPGRGLCQHCSPKANLKKMIAGIYWSAACSNSISAVKGLRTSKTTLVTQTKTLALPMLAQTKVGDLSNVITTCAFLADERIRLMALADFRGYEYELNSSLSAAEL